MERQWWHKKVAYQIYPKSFNDTDGDGIGDIRGIIEKLDYLKELGIDILWISPIYRSPFADQGYDIQDYYQIDPVFGSEEDFDELLAEAKKRDMYVLMDLVVNHCSDRHEWFQKALKDPYGEYADYFYFVKGKDGEPPCNYRSYFGGSVWEPVPGTDLFYLHMFSREQPDLNWENPKVREELFRMVNWWLDKGLSGFRIDAIINIKKDINFPSYEPDGEDGLVRCTKMVEETEGIGAFLEELKEKTFAPHGAFTVAEVFNIDTEELEKFIGRDGYFSTMFDFSTLSAMDMERGWYNAAPYDFKSWRRALFDSQKAAEGIGFLSNIIENHDEPRGVSTYLPAYAQNADGAKLLATVNILLRGLPFLYQGQEIGMSNCPMDSIEEYDDIETKNQYKTAIRAGCSEQEALKACRARSRDNARTPMQWSGEKNAGFTVGTPWMKVNPNYVTVNVREQEKDENSVLGYYKRLIALRKSPEYGEVFAFGSFRPAFEDRDMIFAFYRKEQEAEVLVAANLAEQDALLAPEEGGAFAGLLLRSADTVRLSDGKLVLPSCTAAVVRQ